LQAATQIPITSSVFLTNGDARLRDGMDFVGASLIATTALLWDDEIGHCANRQERSAPLCGSTIRCQWLAE
jgi:hypothetical protein